MPLTYEEARLQAIGDTPILSEADAFEPEREPSRTRTILREVAETLLLALLIYLTVRTVVQNFKVEGSSMEPTLHHGQYLLVNRVAYFGADLGGVAAVVPPLNGLRDSIFYPFGQPQRGDIIVFRYPRDPSRDFIKRVVAIPGETVEIKSGIVYVNNKKLDEPYILESPTYTRELTALDPGHYFVLGDNRSNSSDSHVWGPVASDEIVGKAWLTYWPLKDWGGIPDHSAQAGR